MKITTKFRKKNQEINLIESSIFTTFLGTNNYIIKLKNIKYVGGCI